MLLDGPHTLVTDTGQTRKISFVESMAEDVMYCKTSKFVMPPGAHFHNT